MLILDAPQTQKALPWPALIEALRSGFQQGCTVPLRTHHDYSCSSGATNSLLLMPAWIEGRYLGIKQVIVAPENSKANLPGIQAHYSLSNANTGERLALIDGGELTARRTAAASALAADYLAPKDAHHMLVIGTGRIAENLIYAYSNIRSIQKITIWGRNLSHAKYLAEKVCAAGFNATVTEDCAKAQQEADILCTATFSAKPLILGKNLRSGQHIDLVGAYKPSLRESDDAVMQRSRIFVDTLDGALNEAGDILQAIQSGAIHQESITASLFDLCQGNHQGRKNDSEITLFKSTGHALEDLYAAIFAYESSS